MVIWLGDAPNLPRRHSAFRDAMYLLHTSIAAQRRAAPQAWRDSVAGERWWQEEMRVLQDAQKKEN